jgi:glutathione synthase/RimK-type ligase-like ATP-grasp enzyme
MNKPAAEDVATDKLYQLQLASSLKFPVPRTLVTNDPIRAREFFDECEERVLFKAVSGGAWMRHTHSDEIVQAYGPRLAGQPATPMPDAPAAVFIFSEILTKDRLSLLDHVRFAPVTFQEFIDKRFDIRITMIGDALFACKIFSQEWRTTRVDFRRFVNAPDSTPRHEPCTLPPDVESRVRSLMERLDLSFGCIDLIVDSDDRYVFLEVNPAGQWGWIQQLTGMPISEAIVDELARLASTSQ